MAKTKASELKGIYYKKSNNNTDYYGIGEIKFAHNDSDYNFTMPVPAYVFNEGEDEIDKLFEHIPPIIKLLNFFNKILITITDWNMNKITDLQVSFMRKKILRRKN